MPPRASRNFTVVLSNAEAEHLERLLESFGGSVGGFCASIVRDYLELSPQQIVIVRQQIRELARKGDAKPSTRTGS